MQCHWQVEVGALQAQLRALRRQEAAEFELNLGPAAQNVWSLMFWSGWKVDSLVMFSDVLKGTMYPMGCYQRN